MKLAKYIAAAAISAAFVAAPASAGTLGAADLTINQFFLMGANGPITSGINILADTRTGNASSSYNGVQGTGAGANDILSTTPGATVDVKYRCAGPDCGSLGAVYGTAENNTTTHLTSPQGNFALGDMLIGGSIFNAGGANGLTRANASVENASNEGSANSTIQNSGRAETTFAVGTTITGAFALGYDAYVAAFVDAMTPSNATTNASGTISWSLTLRKVGVAGNILSWTPEQLNEGRFATAANESDTFASSGLIFSDQVTFTPGTYLLTINQASNALASEIPEPGSMILVGLGLAALGAAGRRRRAVK